ncbi:hypothetical protein [Salinibacter ruber]|jgi:hypothetical protein|uniref:hypothetical protein n=1 Tax=Salinibacter ruber TaxID=146919 RepID=UPI00207461A6|nr:hypothetical protein [Salinibacter ruber]
MPDSAGEPDTSRFNVYFAGNRSDIGAEVLLTSIGNMTELLSYVNEQTDSEKDIKITVEAPERGSFGIDVNLLTDTAGLMMGQGDVVAYTEALVSTLMGLFELHQFLDGEKPRSIDVEGNENYVITNSDGNEIHVDKTVHNHYFGDEEPEQLIRVLFASLEKDENIDSFHIRDPERDESGFASKREEFDRLAGKIGEEPRTRTVRDEHVSVTITRVVFDDPGRRWEFLYQGDRIGAKIDDVGFWTQIRTRDMSFRRGDRLEVDLVREQEFSETLNDWETKNRTVIEVHDHIPASEQGDLFDEPGD